MFSFYNLGKLRPKEDKGCMWSVVVQVFDSCLFSTLLNYKDLDIKERLDQTQALLLVTG